MSDNGKNIFRYRTFDIVQEYAAMKVGTDADLLGTLSLGGRRILDIGTGTGILSLMLAQRYPDAEIMAIEIDDNAVLDAKANFAASPYAERITLKHISFQDYLKDVAAEGKMAATDGEGMFDSVVCNPPYFDKSLECKDLGRTRARHSSSLPFRTLVGGAYHLLNDGGAFSVCIPREVLDDFNTEAIISGFYIKHRYEIKTVPEKPAKRFVMVYEKGIRKPTETHVCCMMNADRTRSEWYTELMSDFKPMV